MYIFHIKGPARLDFALNFIFSKFLIATLEIVQYSTVKHSVGNLCKYKESFLAKSHNIDDVFKFTTESAVPKYQQIIDAVLSGITRGVIGKGSHLPSINEVCAHYGLARETVNKAYKLLKEKGVVSSLPGKGFFVTSDTHKEKVNVFVLFDVLLAPYKEILYAGIQEGIKAQAQLDFYFHHYNSELFCQLILDSIGKYEYYVVIPMAKSTKRMKEALGAIDQDKLLILDIDIKYPGKHCAVIRQDHETQLIKALESGIEKIKQYDELTLVFPKGKHHPEVIKKAFNQFCSSCDISGHVVDVISQDSVNHRHAYLLIEDSDLVTLVKACKLQHFKVGKDVGLITYNDTPFKEIICDGVTVLTIDFYDMGQQAARQILSRTQVNLLQPTQLILRNSL